ncbi:MAG: hydroxymethylglutaryl-CoA lyase [Betaproteobacteria bacterium]|nr:hydroxymethylglutaryl-CoA lyase [Betaproteobacteria bacterium]MDE2623190.1 hydroxymethylglutaryl-CoA lyase [Betaproteobacteria bacterium]
MSRLIAINEVVTRDGFQSEPRFIPTEDKIALIDLMSQAGYHAIEVTSFTSPKAIPMLTDAEVVMDGIRRNPAVEYVALIPNVRGAERALKAGVDAFNLVMSVSESHNRANLRMSREESHVQLTDVIRLAHEAGIPVNVSLSTSFGCPFEGAVDPAGVLEWTSRFADLGVRGVSLCDTTGMADPGAVGRLCREALERFAQLELTLHFHNTRGMGLANALAAVQAGIRQFDASLGGLGGCPYAPGATGNICTEELVHMLQLMGYDTGMNMPLLLEGAARVEALAGRQVPSQLLRAGTVDNPRTRACA